MKTGRRIIALLCSVLLLAFAASYNSQALADEVPELNWADLATEETEAQGTFHKIEVPNLTPIQSFLRLDLIALAVILIAASPFI